MTIANRTFLGVKSCEFLAEKHKVPHTEVDEINGHEWARNLYDQEIQQSNNDADTEVRTFYDSHKDLKCDRYTIATNGPCGGATVICAFNDGPLNARLFVGCKRWKGRESGHTCIHLTNFDIAKTLRLWGPDRVQVHGDILEAIAFKWDDNTSFSGTFLEVKFSSNF